MEVLKRLIHGVVARLSLRQAQLIRRLVTLQALLAFCGQRVVAEGIFGQHLAGL